VTYDPTDLPGTISAEVQRNSERRELRAMGEDIIAAGMRRLADGGLQLTPEAYAELQRRSQRAGAVSPVPKLPRTMARDMGGAVPRGAGSGRALLTFDALRRLREGVAIIQVVHAAVHAKLRRVCRRWDGQRHEVGWEITHRDALRPDGRVPRGFGPVIRQFETFMEEPKQGDTLSDFMIRLAEDYLTINRPVVAPLYWAADDRRIVGWEPVDGALILPLADWIAQSTFGSGWIERQVPVTPEGRKALLRDLYGAHVDAMRWVLIRDGIPERFYKDDELIVGDAKTRTDIQWAGYNPSTVETAAELIAAFMGVFQYNANFFRDGFQPDFAILLKGAQDPDAAGRFIQQLQSAAQGVDRAHQPLVLTAPDADSGMDRIELKRSNNEMGFETWLSALVALTCAVYREDPSSINAKPWAGGSGASMNEANRATEIELARADGLQSLLGHITDHILTPMARRCHPDLVVRWHYGEMDPERDAKVYQMRVATDCTPNEARVLRGDAPMPPYWPARELGQCSPAERAAYDANPWNWIQNGTFSAAMTAKLQPSATDDGFGEAPETPPAALAPSPRPPAPTPTPLAKAARSRFAWPQERT
jgi:hypothetical protein